MTAARPPLFNRILLRISQHRRHTVCSDPPIQWLNNRSHGQNLSSASGNADFIAQYLFNKIEPLLRRIPRLWILRPHQIKLSPNPDLLSFQNYTVSPGKMLASKVKIDLRFYLLIIFFALKFSYYDSGYLFTISLKLTLPTN